MGKAGIAYSNHSGINLLNPETGRSRLVTRGVLAAVGPTRIVLLAASGRALGKLPLPPAVGIEGDIFWSPNGKQILVVTGRRNVKWLSVGTVSTKHWQRFPLPNVGRR